MFPRRLMPGWRGELVPDSAPFTVPGCNVHPVGVSSVDRGGDGPPGTAATGDYIITSRTEWPGGPYSRIVRESGETLEQVSPALHASLGVGTRHWQVQARRYSTEAK